MTSSPAPAPKRTNRTVLWINLGLAGLLVVIIGVVFAVIAINSQSSSSNASGTGASASPGASAPADAAPSAMRDDSRVVGEPGSSDVVMVEFLDFECPACGALYPFIESVREQYAGEVTFVVRYFPIESHANGSNAALAAEAAGNQGEFEAMYQRLFETQELWAGQQASMAPVFRGYAEAMGLDMEQYDADVADPATLERVLSDQADGTALGVAGTPTFFLNDEKLEPETYDDFTNSIDEALANDGS